GCMQIGLVVYLSLVPSPPEIPGFHGADKLIHLFTYAFVMFWFGLCYNPGRAYRNLGFGLILIGAMLELIQGKTGYRSMSYFDMLANSLGVSLGWLMARTRLSLVLIYMESRLSIYI
ncbi:VanZ family protein, partial [Thermodesulfobacteriota bacterium]